ncbi:hypothetical protein BDZ90DRAFT_239626 [Jaminaea rosea]|uniref:Purine-cytosine permease n=1 Tax=Jaminaea rosea TaxID=1569628 RepID=A0A316USB5_9BASI|nr:hypothetical protein BDZ90DRAFT_239626 [Jaminaea rosea]PWN28199.1 hypothetical protein BDZ90DRAFT_239626 [Jaminaea rosea]
MSYLAATVSSAEPRSSQQQQQEGDIEQQQQQQQQQHGNVASHATSNERAEKSSSSSSSSSLKQPHQQPFSSSATITSRIPLLRPLQRIGERLGHYHVESVSVAPVPLEARTEKKWWSVGLLWFSANFNVLSFSTGTLVSTLELSAAGAFCTIVFFCLFSALFPAFFVTFGPRLGMRQMIHTRYSWGWFAPLIAILNAASLCGYTILNCILGGQTLSAVSPNGSLTPTVGIVIVAIVSLVVSFMGIRVLHAFERWLWVPVLICFCILAGLARSGPSGLHFPTPEPATTSEGVLAMASIVIGFLVSWSGIASDVSSYMDPATTPTWGLFGVTFLGFFLGSCPLFLLGAAFGLSSLDNPAWDTALSESNGALFNLVLSSKAGNFGKFITVLLGLSIIGNTAPSIYSFGLSMPAILPALRHVPRFVFPLVAIAIVIPLSIVGASAFYDTLVSFTSVLAYWSALFVAVVLVDHWVVRRNDMASYDPAIWCQWKKLPLGLAAIISAVVSLAVLVPSISQTWFTGPIAEHVGDLGFELGFVCCALLYAPLRFLEKRLVGR